MPAQQDGPETLPYSHDPWWYKALILVFVLVPLALTGLGIWLLWGAHVSALDLTLLVSGWALTGMGISVGYHRMLTHRAFEARPAVRFVVLAFGAMSLQGAPADWAATHIRHHARADREGDPHSPLEGFWHAHTGWLVRDRFVRSGPVYAKLMQDPVVAWTTRYFLLLATIGFVIPLAIGAAVTNTWQGALGGLLWGGAVRVFLTHHVTWSVNSVAHSFGTRPFKTVDESRNNLFVALFGFGEGWHNNHHAFPRSAFMGLRWWQFDPGRYLIRALERIGWVWNVWMPSPEDMLKRRARRA